jgi:FkbM family methyltransferase
MGSEEEGLSMPIQNFLCKYLSSRLKSQMVQLHHSTMLMKVTKNWTKAVLDRCNVKFEADGKKNVLLRLRNGDKIPIELDALDTQRVAEIYGEQVYTPPALAGYWHNSRVILDIGANKGIFSIYAAGLFPNSTIHAYEPNPHIFPILKENIRLNNLDGRCMPFNYAVWYQDEELPFMLRNAKNPGTGQIIEYGKTTDDVKTVPGVAFAKVLRVSPEVDFLKMDIEGSEYQVILHTPPDELRRIRFIAMEYHDSKDHSLDELIGHIKAAGFSVLLRPRGSILYAWRSLEI